MKRRGGWATSVFLADLDAPAAACGRPKHLDDEPPLQAPDDFGTPSDEDVPPEYWPDDDDAVAWSRPSWMDDKRRRWPNAKSDIGF
jgi:hypothetical protein